MEPESLSFCGTAVCKMDKITLFDKTFRLYIPQTEVEDAIGRVAAELDRDNAGATDIPILLCVLHGAILFTAELMKRIHFDCQIASVKATSYIGTKSSGNVGFDLGLTADVKGRRVYILEDIVDTGTTILALRSLLTERGAADIKVCTMVFKEEAYHQDMPIDYVGLRIENEFIVGYGLDYDEIGRNLKDIYILDK